MKKIIVYFFILGIISSCNKSDSEEYVEISTPVSVGTNPYQKLSDYHFFTGNIKDLVANTGVFPYEPASGLFTDYADKKRYIWMPKNTMANYVSDGEVLNFPENTVLIKVFYYKDVLPNHTQKIVETRLLIKKNTGWITANYIWNAEQNEAYLNANAVVFPISFQKSNGEQISINYKTPTNTECAYCHTLNNQLVPIGPKPQNLNWNLAYNEGNKNQITKLIEEGYLSSQNIPQNIVSVIDYTNTNYPLKTRVRSYLDANCSYCHVDGGYAEEFNVRFSFNESTSSSNLGICKDAIHFVPGYNANKIIIPGVANQSILYYKMNTLNPNYMMPFVGKTIIHTEGVNLIEQWINSLTDCN
ncbi:hypothetical protein [Flavobacterium croceum]|uniref:hypothetical protein n=1 Tax=Flavobacterium croceum TaxID=370975 RepID=UPI0024A84C27|nr:hypothetical protein [Flavobacterium croceum]